MLCYIYCINDLNLFVKRKSGEVFLGLVSVIKELYHKSF
jgi:hypothetical protein